MDLLEARKQHEDLHQVIFSDHTIVIFRLLSWKEYGYYFNQYNQPEAEKCDEAVFEQCVLEVRNNTNRDKLRAGVVHTITNIILSLSGPKSLENWQEALELARKNSVPTLTSQIEMVICRAFPAYKPDDIWDMGWPMIMNRLAQAEQLLLQTKQIDKPLKFIGNDKNESVQDLVKDAQRIKQVDKSRPVGQSHHINRESNWSKVRD